MLVLNILRITGFPEDAVEQGRYVRKKLLLKVAAIFGRVFVVVSLVKFSIRVTRNNTILSVDINHIDCLSMNGVIFCGYNLIEL